MISEKQLAVHYSSIWNEILPMSDRYMRRINLEAERFIEPLLPEAPAEFNALVNETAFRVYRQKLSAEQITQDAYCEIFESTKSYIERLINKGFVLDSKVRKSIDIDVQRLANRLAIYYERINEFELIQFSPEFSGCGIINNCAGDVLADDILYEIKKELRGQILTYSI